MKPMAATLRSFAPTTILRRRVCSDFQVERFKESFPVAAIRIHHLLSPFRKTGFSAFSSSLVSVPAARVPTTLISNSSVSASCPNSTNVPARGRSSHRNTLPLPLDDEFFRASSIKDRVLSVAESAAVEVASSRKAGAKSRRKAAYEARRNAAAFWDRYVHVDSFQRNDGGRRWDGEGGLCEALMEEEKMAALINDLVDVSTTSLTCRTRSIAGDSTSQDVDRGSAFERATERIALELEAHCDKSKHSIERMPWVEPLVAIRVNGGAHRLPSPSFHFENAHVDQENKDGSDPKKYDGGWDSESGDDDDTDSPPEEGRSGGSPLLDYYCLDPSSLLPVLAMGLHEPASCSPANACDGFPPCVLDMCAAPGGKTIALLQLLFGPSSPFTMDARREDWPLLVANEPSRLRRARLRRVIRKYVPPVFLPYVSVSGLEGSSFGRTSFGRRMYDVQDDASETSAATLFSHVLCDVPCSGERHLLRPSGGKELAKWRPGAGRTNRARQEGLLKASIAACRSGGTIVYSTCSVDPAENDGVVQKVLSKRGYEVHLTKTIFSIGEETDCGWMVLPDHPSCRGFGPMYIAKLQKI